MYAFEIEAPYFFSGNHLPGLAPDPRFIHARVEYERMLRLFERWKPDFASDSDRDGSA